MDHLDGIEYPGNSNDEDVPFRHNLMSPHQCNICQKTFTSYKGLQQHYVIHTDERPFKCEVCSQSFRFKSNLFEHQSVHTGFTPYKCSYCDKTCRLKGNLKKHLRTHVTNKEELEAAWRPFAKQDPARRKSAPYAMIQSAAAANRTPLSNIRDDNGFSTPTTSSYRMPTRRKAKGVGSPAHWLKLIKGGVILPQVDLDQKIQQFEHNVMSQAQPFTTWAELLEFAKSIAFETHNCPVCDLTFMSRDDCDGHCQVEHPTMRNPASWFCEKCIRLFNDEDSFEQHVKYHIRVKELIQSEPVTMEAPEFVVPLENEFNEILHLNETPKHATDLEFIHEEEEAFY
uniref:Zinc finger protein n=1 Tax=Caenorhabditis tropicalis TaxID=1561998 RepID=A0A1I7TGW3_9PELO